MAVISQVCANLFNQTDLAQSPIIPSRGFRRNLARLVYRQGRRPGLVNPQSEPGPHPIRKKYPRRELCVQKPMRHVYKLHEPSAPKKRISMDMVPRLAR